MSATGSKEGRRPPTHLGLVFPCDREAYRRILRGLGTDAATQPHWTLTWVPPEAQPLKCLRSLPLAGPGFLEEGMVFGLGMVEASSPSSARVLYRFAEPVVG